MKIGKWKDLDNQCSGRDLDSYNNIDFIYIKFIRIFL